MKMRLNKPFYALVDPKTNCIMWDPESPITGANKRDVRDERDDVILLIRENRLSDFMGRTIEEWQTYEIRKIKIVEA